MHNTIDWDGYLQDFTFFKMLMEIGNNIRSSMDTWGTLNFTVVNSNVDMIVIARDSHGMVKETHHKNVSKNHSDASKYSTVEWNKFYSFIMATRPACSVIVEQC